MKIRYLEEGEEIPNLKDDMGAILFPDIQTYSWVDEIKVVLDEGAIMPTRGHSDDAGIDLYAPKNMVTKYLWKGDSVIINSGVHIAIPRGYVGMLKSRSGLNVKHSIIGEGVIDSGYTGAICIKLYNLGTERLKIEPGDKIIQLVILPIITPKLVVVDSLPKTERNDRGFGSTGRK